MGTLIDLCGTPIELDHVRQFRLVKRDYLFYPAYQEVQEQKFSLFARKGASDKKKFEFVKMVPFGAVLNDREKPCVGSYEVKSFGEAVTFNILSDVGKKLENVANIAADLLRVDTSGNTEYHILTQGRRLTNIRLRDIPAKVCFLSGKVSDVYKNDSIYEFLGEPIAPTIVTVPTLVVTVDKTTYAFFGSGIDLMDAEVTYQTLLEAYNQYQESNKKEKAAALPKFNVNIPKISIPAIKVQSPFVIKRDEAKAPTTELIAEKTED